MKILSIDIQIKKAHQNPKEFCDEFLLFKSNFKNYVIRKINKKTELWAFGVEDTDEVYFLGHEEKGRIILSDKFRTYPWDVQKGAGRLCRIYLHNDDREL